MRSLILILQLFTKILAEQAKYESNITDLMLANLPQADQALSDDENDEEKSKDNKDKDYTPSIKESFEILDRFAEVLHENNKLKHQVNVMKLQEMQDNINDQKIEIKSSVEKVENLAKITEENLKKFDNFVNFEKTYKNDFYNFKMEMMKELNETENGKRRVWELWIL